MLRDHRNTCMCDSLMRRSISPLLYIWEECTSGPPYKHTPMLENTRQFSKTHANVRKHVPMLENTRQYLKTHPNVRKHAPIFEHTPQCLKTHPNVRKHSPIVKNTRQNFWNRKYVLPSIRTNLIWIHEHVWVANLS